MQLYGGLLFPLRSNGGNGLSLTECCTVNPFYPFYPFYPFKPNAYLCPLLKKTTLAKKSATAPAADSSVTPLMQQYFQMKSKYPDAIMLFRVGDFYETFGEDAVKTSAALGIVLTKRNNGGSDIELAGFPHHAMDIYLPRLVRAGHRVAICDQLEKPSPHKKIVKRGVTEVVTPGIAVDDKLLDHQTNNYLASLAFGKREEVGMAFFGHLHRRVPRLRRRPGLCRQAAPEFQTLRNPLRKRPPKGV